MLGRWCVSLALALSAVPAAAASEDQGQDLSNLSIEELAQIPVRSASKHDEPLSAATTALYVITGDDIQRSTATSLPELLRMAPNLHVERVNGSQHAVTARGFNGVEPSNKLLVLIDGRSVYSTLHSGVFWELHSPLLEDLQQIEVISGPGGTLYGPNAVNGVISIRSKDAADTLGVLARGTVGARERTAAARFGTQLGSTAAVRVYADYFDREDMPTGFGPVKNDGIRGWQAGFRADLDTGAGHATLQGDIFDHDTFLVPGDGNRGNNLLARWSTPVSDASSVQVQGYYDYFKRRSILTVDVLETFDVEGQYTLHTESHDLVAGVGMRTARDEFVNNLNFFQLDPPRDRHWIWTGFVQDRFAISSQVSVTTGVKLERSSFSGLQLLPNLRLGWQPSDKALFWGSVSRAVRTPSRIDRFLTAPGFLSKAPDFRGEKLTAFEAGYRGQPTDTTSLSVSLFYNRYDDLRSLDFITGNVLPVQLMNDIEGRSYGVEAWATQQLTGWWRLSAGGAWLHKAFKVTDGERDISSGASLGRDPVYQLQLRSQMNLPHGIVFDADVRAVDDLEAPHIDGYVEAGARVGIAVADNVELYVAGENLLHASHFESNDVQRTQRIARSVYFGTRLRF
jgi:iron complex outermembrane receptor protein